MIKTRSIPLHPFGAIAALGVMLAALATPAEALVVSFSTTNAVNDQSLIDFINNNFSNVDTINTGDYSNPANIPAGTDVFIVGRNINSTSFANATNSSTFNSLTIPVVSFTSYVTRTNSGRWAWESGDVTGNFEQNGSETAVTAAGATVLGYAEGSHDFISISGSEFGLGRGTVGTGSILATIPATNPADTGILAAGWLAGQQSAGGATFGGNRLLWNVFQGPTQPPDTAKGKTALIRALTFYTPLLAAEDVAYTTSPSDGATLVAVDSSIVVTATDVTANLASVMTGNEMLVNGSPVSPVTVDSSNGTTTFTYTPASNLANDTTYSVQLNVQRSDAATDTVDFSFTTIAANTKLVLISGTNPTNDQALIDFITNSFQDVVVSYGDYSDYSANATAIEAADVFMVGRSLSSPAYGNATNSASFNALSIPVVSFTSYVTRPDADRWGWHSGGVVVGAPIFGSETVVTLAGTSAFGIPAKTYDWVQDVGANTFDAAGSGEAGEGEILATINGDILAAHWNAGDLSGDGVTTFGGQRFLYNLKAVTGVTQLPTDSGKWALIKALEAYAGLTMLPSLDSDGDGLPDEYEMEIIDFDAGDAVTELAHVAGPDAVGSTDFDSDGLSDTDEFLHNTDFAVGDSDADGLTDNQEITGSENGFAVPDGFFSEWVGTPGAPTDPLVADSDGDGLSDLEECTAGVDGFVSDPNNQDTDADFLSDKWESENELNPADDGFTILITLAAGDPDNGADGDPDSDGLENFDEQSEGSNPQVADTDADDLNDGPEFFGDLNSYDASGTFVGAGNGGAPTNLLVADSDGDGILDGEEAIAGVDGYVTNPNAQDTDGDGFSDSFEVAQGSDPANGSDTPAGLIAVTNSVAATTNVSASSDATTGVLFTTPSFNMNGGNAVALIMTSENLANATTTMNVTFAGQTMTPVTATMTTTGGSQSTTIFYLIDPSITEGVFEVTVDPGLSGIALAYSHIALSNVPGLADTDIAVSESSAGTTPLELSYKTGSNNGYVLGGAVNNAFNTSSTPLSVQGNPDTNLLTHTLVGTSGHFHTHGRVSPAGSYTDGYLGQLQRTAIVTVVFGEPAAGGFSDWSDANAPGQTADQDHDLDGVPNGVEYFMGETGSTFTINPGSVAGTITWLKNAEYSGTYQVQTSPDLVSWTDVTGSVVDDGSSVEYTIPTGMGKLFVRLVVVPD